MDGDGKDPIAVDEEEVDESKDGYISSSEEEESEDEKLKRKKHRVTFKLALVSM